jgi:hypothetical protein
MKAKYLVTLSLCLLFIPLTGCIVNKAISAGAVADNLAVEKAQNEVLLLNVLRAREHLPMYLTSISKITGSVKAEAVLNPTAPFGSVTGGSAATVETGTRAHYMGAATATYNWNPSFDVNVLDTSEFMRGFLSPITGDTFAYYWNQDYPPEILFHLTVQKIKVTVNRDICAATKRPSGRPGKADEYVFHNHPDALDPKLIQLKAFTNVVSKIMDNSPYMGSGDGDPLEPALTKDEALHSRAIVEALKGGYVLGKQAAEAPAKEKLNGEQQTKPQEKTGETFRFQRAAPPPVLKLSSGALKNIYDWIQSQYGEIPNEGSQKTLDSGVEMNIRDAEPVKIPGACPAPADKLSADPPDQLDDAVNSKSLDGKFTQSGVITTPAGKHDKVTVTFSLRSPEAIIYYLGQLARLEKQQNKVYYVCLQRQPEPVFAPIFLILDKGCKGRLAEATTGDGNKYFIPEKETRSDSTCIAGGELRDLACDPGASTTALSIVSQLIALQKSAKDLPTTSVVRVVGQ